MHASHHSIGSFWGKYNLGYAQNLVANLAISSHNLGISHFPQIESLIE